MQSQKIFPTKTKTQIIKINLHAYIGWFEILIVVAVAIIILGPKDFPIMLKKAGSWIGTAKRYVNNIQNQVSNINIEIDDEEEKNNKIKKENKKDE